MLREFVQRYRFRKAMSKALSGARPGDEMDAKVVCAIKRAQSLKREGKLAEIERRRAKLLADTSHIELIDFGAGDAGSDRETENPGVHVTTTVDRVARASKPEGWAKLLYCLVGEFKPANAVELGTCVGISGSYIATAQAEAGGGTLTSLEGDPATAGLARETFSTLGLSDAASVVVGPFSETYARVLEQTHGIDFLFIDGHHDEFATITYFEQAIPHLNDRALIVFDDIRWSDGMTRAWQSVRSHPRSRHSIDLSMIGLVELN